ncbi:MAG: SACOL1771 family peroxiredoxin [Solibacillus sp.]|jgi:peroxiredoxin-like protein|uniref:SACOL1771 family peroxiredoxin n=1 Tax=unclassified Solibacillus TaxID=2637870 RepID=UPI0030FBD0D0
MTVHTFKLTIDWPGGRNHVGDLSAERLHTKISIPPEMEGPGIGTNPDEMLLGAAATCYIITLAAMLERSNIKAQLTLHSEGKVDVTNGVFTYKEIHHYVEMQLNEQSEKESRLAERYAYKAEETCMISKALKGNVNIQVHLTIK